ncbi:oligosaccharide flippase family protein [Candidatus Gracilibacteria bacterium]|nr:oligosaccharide flippase family protein [Candidatus Gracilibacteria bacterium]
MSERNAAVGHPPEPAAALPQQALSGGTIRIAARGVQLLLGIGTGMLLARLLTPAEFGLFAMVGSLTAFVGSFRDWGLPAAVSHQHKLDDGQMDALFWINLRLNLLVALFMALMAPLLAWFYGEARLTAITLVMTLGMFAIGLSVQHESLLTRQMRWGLLTLIETSALFVSSALALGLALAGMSYWALVGQFMANLLLKSSILWLASPWRPRRRSDTTPGMSVGSILAYSRNVTVFRVLTHIGRNLDRVVVGFSGGPAAMGLYDRSYQWSTFPVTNIYGPLLGVAVASLSRVQHDAVRYRDLARRALLPIFATCLPALAFMAVEAANVVALLLGAQWLAAVPLFRVLCIAAFVGCTSTVTKALYLSAGSTARQLRWGLIAAPLTIAAVLVGSIWGVYGVALGYSAATIGLAYPSVRYCLYGSHLRPCTSGGFSGGPLPQRCSPLRHYAALATVCRASYRCCLNCWSLLRCSRPSTHLALYGCPAIVRSCTNSCKMHLLAQGGSSGAAWPEANKPMSTQQLPSLALAMCVRDEESFLAANLAYHHALGVSRAYIFLDRCSDSSPQIARSFPWVDAIPCDRDPAERYMSSYQLRCLQKALELARADGIEWLLHLDADEFARGDGDRPGQHKKRAHQADLRVMLAAVKPTTAQVILRPQEAIPTPLAPDDPFWKLHFFQKRGVFKRKLLDPSSNILRLLDMPLGHDKGKSIVRTAAQVRPESAHRWQLAIDARSVKPPALASEMRGLHYHFAVVDARQWYEKHRKFSEYPDQWEKGRPVRFPKQAWKEASVTMSPAEAHAYFSRWVVVRRYRLLWSLLRGQIVHDTFVERMLAQLKSG